VPSRAQSAFATSEEGRDRTILDRGGRGSFDPVGRAGKVTSAAARVDGPELVADRVCRGRGASPVLSAGAAGKLKRWIRGARLSIAALARAPGGPDRDDSIGRADPAARGPLRAAAPDRR